MQQNKHEALHKTEYLNHKKCTCNIANASGFYDLQQLKAIANYILSLIYTYATYGISGSSYQLHVCNYYIDSYRQKLLARWLTLIPHLQDTISNHYQKGAILMMDVKSKNSAYQKVIVAVIRLQKELPIVFYDQGNSLQGTNLCNQLYFTNKHTCITTYT